MSKNTNKSSYREKSIANTKFDIRIHKVLNAAIDLHQRGLFSEAFKKYEEVLAVHPKNFEALHLTGLLSYQMGNAAKGAERMKVALSFNPNSIACLVNLGLAEHAIGELENSISRYKRAIELKGDFQQAHFNLANAYRDIGYFDLSINEYLKAIEIDPVYADAYLNLGNVWERTRQWQKALLALSRLIYLRPTHAQAYNNRGNVYKGLMQWAKSAADFDTSIRIDGKYMDAYLNKGNLFKELGYWDQAAQCYNHVLNINSKHATALWNNAILSLTKGDYSAGWRDYELRWAQENKNALRLRLEELLPAYSAVQWRGNEELVGKSILIYPEQGLGDTIQFVRFVPRLKKLGARVILVVQSNLVELCKCVAGVDYIYGLGERAKEVIDIRDAPLLHYDFVCPLMSLPLALKIFNENEFIKTPYLFADPDLSEKWSALLGAKKTLRIGLSWRGSPYHVNDQYRSTSLSQLMQAIPNGSDCISLQKDITKEEKVFCKEYGQGVIREYSELLTDFSETAALCNNLDIIICVDTSIAHLAAALGLEVWLLVSYSSDWRWLIDRVDSPWYERLKIFRQNIWGDWKSVYIKIYENLENKVRMINFK